MEVAELVSMIHLESWTAQMDQVEDFVASKVVILLLQGKLNLYLSSWANSLVEILHFYSTSVCHPQVPPSVLKLEG